MYHVLALWNVSRFTFQARTLSTHSIQTFNLSRAGPTFYSRQERDHMSISLYLPVRRQRVYFRPFSAHEFLFVSMSLYKNKFRCVDNFSSRILYLKVQQVLYNTPSELYWMTWLLFMRARELFPHSLWMVVVSCCTFPSVRPAFRWEGREGERYRGKVNG